MKERIYRLLFPGESPSRASTFVEGAIMALIGGNVLALMLETVESIRAVHAVFFWRFEVFSVAVFTVEYLARIYACTCDHRYAHPISGRLRYACSFLALIDLLAIAPFYTPILFGTLDFRNLRVLRLMRLLKIGRFSNAFLILGRVMNRSREELLTAVFVMLLILILASSLMYEFEHEVQPEAFPSIPASLWWGVTTLTTVGYGDACPVTALGRICAGIVAVIAIGMFALPTGILSSGFLTEIENMKKAKGPKKSCPHCGNPVDD